MSKYHASLVEEIDAFLAREGMSEVTFGRKAMGDPHFVRDIRASRLLRPETEERCRRYISDMNMAERIGLCELCSQRPDEPTVRACVQADCPNRERRVA